MPLLAAGLVLLAVGGGAIPLVAAPQPTRPNIVLVLVDDLGFSDLGCYGGEIETPQLDRLAGEGLRFTQFYNCAKCETTRATLLSGRYHPEVGVRKMTRCVTIAEALKSGGYTTLMAGKWHLSSTPRQRGFDRYFGHLSGACNFFKGDDTFLLDDEPFEVPEAGFYTTAANTDYAIEFLSGIDPNRPFFLYLAYNAPHYPLHVLKSDFEKYRGRYRGGWDELRAERLARIRELGLLPPDWDLPPRPADVPAWDTLSPEQRDTQDLVMAAYAGMVECVDRSLGRLRAKLEAMDAWENTLFLFLSDNGACPFQRTTPETIERRLPPYDPDSYWTYDKGWAHACNTPFREYKRDQHEGGISTPFIVSWPGRVRNPGTISRQPGHLVDVMATFLDAADVDYPTTHAGQPVGRLRGHSLVPVFEGAVRERHDYLFFSFYGNHNAVRVGDWKLVNKDRGPWELYNLRDDRTELRDLSNERPDRLEVMQARWRRAALEIMGDDRKPPRSR